MSVVGGSVTRTAGADSPTLWCLTICLCDGPSGERSWCFGNPNGRGRLTNLWCLTICLYAEPFGERSWGFGNPNGRGRLTHLWCRIICLFRRRRDPSTGAEVAASTTPATGDAEAEVLSVTSFKTCLGPQSALKKVRQLPDPRKG